MGRWRGGDFFALPWPAEERLNHEGAGVFAGLPAAQHNYLLSTYLPLMEPRIRGFSPNGAAYFFFQTDPGLRLPSVTQTTQAQGAIQLININSASPRFGERIPVESKWLKNGDSFVPPHTLAILPLAGFPMEPASRYLLVLARSLWPQPVQQTALPTRWNETRNLFRDMDLQADKIVAATIIPVADPLRYVKAGYNSVQRGNAPLPVSLTMSSENPECDTFEQASFRVLEGRFRATSYLSGEAPYKRVPSGQFTVTGEVLEAMDREIIPYLLTIPAGYSTAGTAPLVLYLHGAGGSRRSFIRDGTACSMAQRGVAVLGIEFPVHGDRSDGSNAYLMLSNPENLVAALNIENQASIDLFSTVRMIRRLIVPAALAGTTKDLSFARAPLGFVGHSQGSLAGVPFLAFEKEVSAAVISGSGGHMITFITDRIAGQTIDAKMYLGANNAKALGDLISVLLGVPGDKIDRFHMLLTILQTILDPIDPVNYGPYILRYGDAPKHIYQSDGLLDPFDPPGVNQALATSIGLDVAAPAFLDYLNMRIAGARTLEPPISYNRKINGVGFTAINSQFPGGDHWVWLSDPVARKQGSDFLAGALRGKPVVSKRCAWNGTTYDC